MKKMLELKKKAVSMPVSPEKYNIEKIIEELKGREKLKFESLKQLLTETSSILSISTCIRKRTHSPST